MGLVSGWLAVVGWQWLVVSGQWSLVIGHWSLVIGEFLALASFHFSYQIFSIPQQCG
jgi:hypothetical protein